MRVLVLGGAGMLGHKVFQLARTRFPETWCTLRGTRSDPWLAPIEPDLAAARVIERLDVMDWTAVEAVLHDVRPDVVINCVGIVKQRSEAKAAIPSITVNSLLPHRLAAVLASSGGRLIHISTDCVFSGRRGRYTEEDQSDAEDLYGRSKFLGEVADANALTIRTSMIGRELRERRSLLEWVLQQNGRTIRGFRRAYYSGLTTNELAAVILRVIEEHPALSGVYQVTSDTISKYDLLRLIVDVFGLDIRVEPDDEFVCDRSMVGEKFRAATGHVSPSWPALLRAVSQDPTPYAREWVRTGE
ncbi:MAG TPA: SDR family oxidoreductase [Vicinamibacterales bacterium]|nr:SDR family oxidoreductase [Vicinamibacterales bacterium]